MVTTDYLRHVIDIDELPDTIENTITFIKKHNLEFDAIAFRGSSGMLVAPSVALALRKPMILVRKPTEETHSYLHVEGFVKASSYLILDDQISSGHTVNQIAEEISEVNPEAKCAGIVLYNIPCFLTTNDFNAEYGYMIP